MRHFSYATASSWIISSHPVGNPLTGIRGDASKLPFNESGSFAFVSGPVDFSRMSILSFYLDRKVYFIFSYHKVSSLLQKTSNKYL
uniref:DM13 domain-containing protein n=1 Tax=Angiostrongylus cantonensis TaxID=6313 RepID=A0A0K0DPB0_ANGCA